MKFNISSLIITSSAFFIFFLSYNVYGEVAVEKAEKNLNIIEPLFWAIFGGVFSTALTFAVPPLMAYFKYKKHPELLNNWKSSYQGIDEPKDTWVTEDIFIDTHYGKLRFKNSSSSQGYDYTATGQLVRGNHIIGEWESIRPGANANGCFMLTVCGQGECMYGYWVGSDRVGARRYGRWVLARTKKQVEEAKKHLEEMRKSRIQ